MPLPDVLPDEDLVEEALELGRKACVDVRIRRLVDRIFESTAAEVAAFVVVDGEAGVAVATRGNCLSDAAPRHRLSDFPNLAGPPKSGAFHVRCRSERHPLLDDGRSAVRSSFSEMVFLQLEGDRPRWFLSALCSDATGFSRAAQYRFSRLAVLAAAAVPAFPQEGLLSLQEPLRTCGTLRAAGTPNTVRLVGRSPQMNKLRQDIAASAGDEIPVLVTGETGVGKELAARRIHSLSSRKTEPFVVVNCSAVSESLAESALFGHVDGAFTDAAGLRAGYFAKANGGTMFLDEVGELSLAMQAKLLRVLESGELQRVGSDESFRTDIRIIAATNRDLRGWVRSGRFRADLYHRLNGFPIRIPPLRERIEDISDLVDEVTLCLRCSLRMQRIDVAPAAMDWLVQYDWPGNVREMYYTIERAALRAAVSAKDGRLTIDESHLAIDRASSNDIEAHGEAEDVAGLGFSDAVQDFQRRLIVRALRESGDNWNGAARQLAIDPSNLHRAARRLGLKKKGKPRRGNQ